MQTGQKTDTTPNRNAGDCEKSGSFNLNFDAPGAASIEPSGTNTSPIPLIVSFGPSDTGTERPNCASHCNRYVLGSVTELLTRRWALREMPCDRNNGSGSARRPKRPADQARPPAVLNVTVLPMVHRGISLLSAGASHQLELLSDSIERFVDSGSVSLKSTMGAGEAGNGAEEIAVCALPIAGAASNVKKSPSDCDFRDVIWTPPRKLLAACPLREPVGKPVRRFNSI